MRKGWIDIHVDEPSAAKRPPRAVLVMDEKSKGAWGA
jgi:hypothetical protein